MSEGIFIALIAAGGAMIGAFFQAVLPAWFKGHGAGKLAGVKLEEHRDGLAFDVIDVAREEIQNLRSELAELRPMIPRIAHLEEALDHLHAMLHSDGDIERVAAERRAKGFLRRMRPEIGDLRQLAQVRASAEALEDGASTDNRPRVGRRLDPKPSEGMA
jgi:hypothetical protein